MQVSILLVTYNSLSVIPACIDSIRRGAADVEHEIIAVDNASSDGTAEWLRGQPDIRLIANRRNEGFARAANAAAEAASGELLFLLNPDCRLQPGCLWSIYDFMRDRPWVGACGPKLISPNGELIRSCRTFPSLWTVFCEAFGLAQAFPNSRIFAGYYLGGWDYSDARRVDWLSGAALAIRRDIFHRLGGLDEQFFIYAEDLDFLYRLRAAGWECWYLPQAEVVHEGGASWRGLELHRAMWAHWSLWLYFRKHRGWAYAGLARALTAAGAAARWAAWCLRAAGGDKRARERAAVHRAVLAMALGLRRPEVPP